MAPVARTHAVEGSLKDFRPAASGRIARFVAAIAVVAGILLLPLALETTQDLWFGLGAIYAVIGLSVNVLTGHAGQISLGHQAFVGIGAFMAAFVVKGLANFETVGGVVIPPPTIATSDFVMAILAAGLIGMLTAVVLGLVALRIRGLYLALVTLAFGLMAENTIFGWEAFTGGGAGAFAPRPAAFETNQAFAYLCLLVLGLFLFMDWRLVKSRAGRAIVAIRNEERVAMTMGVNVTGYKLLAFGISGFLAGVAGGLFGHWNQAVQALDFELRTALVWILMAVVGGLGSRAGVVIGSAFFAVFPLYLSAKAGGATLEIPLVGEVLIQTLSPFFGALLLLLTITLYPGGIAQQLVPFRRWLSGGPFVESRHEAFQVAGFPFLVGFLATLTLMGGGIGVRLLVGLVVGVATAAIASILLLLYVRAVYRSVRAHPTAHAEETATAPGAEALVHADEDVSGDSPATAVDGDDPAPGPEPEPVEPAASGSTTRTTRTSSAAKKKTPAAKSTRRRKPR
jgi:branched-chain amino acid transport system permease protein